MNIFNAYARNGDRITQGATFIAGEADNGKPIEFKIARAHESYATFQTKLQEELAARKVTLNSLAKSDKAAESRLRSEIVLSVFIDTCIKGWTNFYRPDGTVVEYGDAGLKELAAVPEFVEELFKFASDDSNYVGEFNVAEAVKN